MKIHRTTNPNAFKDKFLAISSGILYNFIFTVMLFCQLKLLNLQMVLRVGFFFTFHAKIKDKEFINCKSHGGH